MVASRTPKQTTWANRALALILASGTDRTQLSKALVIFEPDGKPVRAGQEGKILEHKSLSDPEDLRVLSRVLDMQKTVVHRKRAIEILETLANKNLATSEDRFMLAHLYEAIGDWPKAREKYRELNLPNQKPPGHGNSQPSTHFPRPVRRPACFNIANLAIRKTWLMLKRLSTRSSTFSPRRSGHWPSKWRFIGFAMKSIRLWN